MLIVGERVTVPIKHISFNLQKVKEKKKKEIFGNSQTSSCTLESHWSINWSRMKREGGP